MNGDLLGVADVEKKITAGKAAGLQQFCTAYNGGGWVEDEDRTEPSDLTQLLLNSFWSAPCGRDPTHLTAAATTSIATAPAAA